MRRSRARPDASTVCFQTAAASFVRFNSDCSRITRDSEKAGDSVEGGYRQLFITPAKRCVLVCGLEPATVRESILAAPISAEHGQNLSLDSLKLEARDQRSRAATICIRGIGRKVCRAIGSEPSGEDGAAAGTLYGGILRI